MSILDRASVAASDDAPTRPAQAHPGGAVVLWATLGLSWAVFALQGWIRWLLSSTEDRPQPKGNDPIPTWAEVVTHLIEGISVVALVVMVWLLVVTPLRSRGRLGIDGMLVVGSAFAFFIDPVINQFRSTFAWSAYAVNRGSWAAYIPLHRGSTRFGEGLLWALPQYVYLGAGGGLLGWWLILRMRHRAPGISTPRAMLQTLAIFMVIDFVLENAFIRADMYSYARGWKTVTLWSGSQYQFPLYNSLFVGLYALGFTYVRLQWHDRGGTSIDAGLNRVRGSLQAGVQLFSYIGYAAFVAAAAYFIPWSWVTVNADAIAHLPSYLRAG